MTVTPLRLAAGLCAVLTAATFVVAVGTPPFSGPFCTDGCFTYPYTDVASRFPRDYLWMFLAIPQVGSYLLLLVTIHDQAAPSARVWSLAGLVFGTIAAGTLMVTYWVQLSVIQPSLLRGETDGIALLSQFNPHGLFIAQEEIGYLLIALSLALASAAIRGSGRLRAALRWLFRIALLAAAIATVWIVATLGHDREYFLEVALIGVDMVALIVGAALLALLAAPATEGGDA